jgi:tetratricopeptide (TPR) repeat protein
VSHNAKPQRQDRRKNRTIVVLVALIVVLLGVVLWLAFRAGAGAQRGLGERLAQLPGLQLLLGQLDLGWAGITSRGEQLLEQGAALEREGKTVEALRLYQQAQEAMPKKVDPHLALASAHETLGEGKEALEHLEQAVELDPEHAQARRELGRLQCLRGDYDACTETLRTAVELEPDNPQGHYWLGLAHHQGAEDGFAEAERAYLRSLHLEPGSAKTHLALGGLYQSQPGMEALAFEQIDEALRLAIQNQEPEVEAKAHAELARYYYAQNNYDLCVQEWQKVLEDQPEDEDALRRLGFCLAMRSERGDLESAVAALERSLELDFGQMDAYYFYLGQYYASQEEYTRAFFAWDQFLRFSEDEELKAEVRTWLQAYQEAMQEGEAP